MSAARASSPDFNGRVVPFLAIATLVSTAECVPAPSSRQEMQEACRGYIAPRGRPLSRQSRSSYEVPEVFTIVICVSPLFSLADCETVTVTELEPFCMVIIPPALVVMVCALGPPLSL